MSSCSEDSGSDNGEIEDDDAEAIGDVDVDADEDCDSKKTDRCQFPKYHLMTHVIPFVERYGSIMNVDAGQNESHHKYLTKSTEVKDEWIFLMSRRQKI